MKKTALVVLLALLATSSVIGSSGAGNRAHETRYVVLAREGASARAFRSALRAAGARVVRGNDAIGLATVVASDDFAARAMKREAIAGVARDRIVGRTAQRVSKWNVRPWAKRRGVPPSELEARNHLGEDPLSRFQWALRMVGAGPSSSYEFEKGDERVMVGVMDSGISPRHVDIGDNLDQELSRNFTTDIPVIDGVCKDDPDGSCEDPANVDEGGHGTWVASVLAGADNGRGILGVAPEAKLVSLRVGQDSGYVFLQPVVDAMTYAGDIGIDVVNMSFFIDPWQYNCPDNPADSPEAQQEQRMVVEATERAVEYARDRGVTFIGVSGNSWTDLDDPGIDEISPTFLPGRAYERDVDDSCSIVPVETDGVITVGGTGPSGRKSWFANWGSEVSVAAPSGDEFDEALPFPYNLVIGAWPKRSLEEARILDENGAPLTPDVLRRCRGKGKQRCFYWAFGAGTSIGGPLATGVAALIVSRFGVDDGNGGLTMEPDDVEAILLDTARPHDCPEGGTQTYPEVGDTLEEFGITDEELTAQCEGTLDSNTFYGHGIVNALDAVSGEATP